jgi:hypothetical protein
MFSLLCTLSMVGLLLGSIIASRQSFRWSLGNSRYSNHSIELHHHAGSFSVDVRRKLFMESSRFPYTCYFLRAELYFL